VNSEDVNQLIQHYPKLAILNAEKEAVIAKAMDHSMDQLAQILLRQENLLPQISDILLAQYENSPVLDDFLTQYDLWLLSQHSDALAKITGVTQKTLSRSLISLQCDRSSVFEFLLSKADEIKAPLSNIARSLREDYHKKRNQLVQGNLRLVMHIAKRYADKGVDTEELIQEGSLGLIKAAEKYNFHKGFRFTTYAYWWIQQAVKQALNQKRSAIRIPINTSDRILKINKAKQYYFNRYEQQPSLQQLKKLTGLTKEQIKSVDHVTNLTVSMSSSSYEDGLMLEETLNQNDINSDNYSSSYSNTDMMNINDIEKVKSRLKKLPERQQKVVNLYHGIGISDGLSFGEIAPQIGVSLERTRQLYHKSISFLREESVYI
jgi:RNA polymerase primary sigma factor